VLSGEGLELFAFLPVDPTSAAGVGDVERVEDNAVAAMKIWALRMLIPWR